MSVVSVAQHPRFRRMNQIAEGYLALANDAAEGMRRAGNKYDLENHRQRHASNMRLFAKRRDSQVAGNPQNWSDAS